MIGSLAKNAVKARLKWLKRALPHQLPPSEADSWSTWWLNAGRGAGKTRCAAEWVWWQAWRRPKTRGLVLAPTANDLRFTCFEGESGLLNVIPQELIANYNKSTHELLFKNGSHIRGISGDSYERLRGPQFAFAWVDEIGAFEYSQQAWSMMQFGLRLGNHPRVICTSTPKPIPLLFSLKKDMELKKGNVIITNASTYANIKNLSPRRFKINYWRLRGLSLAAKRFTPNCSRALIRSSRLTPSKCIRKVAAIPNRRTSSSASIQPLRTRTITITRLGARSSALKVVAVSVS